MVRRSKRDFLTNGKDGKLARQVFVALVLSLVLLPGAALAAPDPPARHVVQPGETLAGIAAQHGSTIPAVIAANLLRDPDQIDAGAVLIVPTAASPLMPIDVQPGDTLFSLARLYHTKPADLLAINELETPVRLIPGQNLLVPAPATGRSLAL
ncbi:MAG: LysM peptidoglycan-binding domain-containing protein, partial [Anaerolineae bacterium]|nr:LysM peptidoglycan-binding domain-containing protein [Anaerolineae bacterium]